MTVALGATAERICIDNDWRFAFGHTDPARDYGSGTEYFNYLTKAASVHNIGPYAMKFNDSTWTEVDLPHDFVADLPFAHEASHSHGYKTVGYKYPETSVGWYRKVLPVAAEDSVMRLSLVFDGIFRDSRVWFNGFYLGGEPSGYTQQTYDITPYVNWGGDNVIAVRSDATLEEGWFYEGGGIYRHAWLDRKAPRHIADNSIATSFVDGPNSAVTVSGRIANRLYGVAPADNETWTLNAVLIDPQGNKAAEKTIDITGLPAPGGDSDWSLILRPDSIVRWDIDNPALYTIGLTLSDGRSADSETVVTGFRTVEFDSDRGMLLNGRPVKLKGVNLHQDHAGVGAGIPDAVNIYRLKELKKYGVNAYRSSHNPMTPEVLAACDSLGILVIEENRLLGINGYHTSQLRRMIDRDRNHPSVIMWSVGNEEWGVEWDEKGRRIVSELRDVCHRLDPTRPMTVATSGGPMPIIPADVAGYNYIMQNPVEKYRAEYPARCAYGSEETSGCGTRGVYFDDRENGRMASLNRIPDSRDSCLNRIERGWRFYADRPWLAGLFYWTGFDYRGEPNPLEYPATGSEFGLLDYCGFPKDEAWYLKSWWTDEPVLYVFPHWNLEGHEGETIDLWVYSNMDEVELIVNGKNLGRKTMPRNGHLSWPAVYRPGSVEARGYRNGRRVMTRKVETTGQAVRAIPDYAYSKDDIQIINVSLVDSKGRTVPTACNPVTITYGNPYAAPGQDCGIRLLGAGNGDPAFRGIERPAPGSNPASFTIPAFNGHAQFIIHNPHSCPVSITLGDESSTDN
ncbi:glycoside hydrolase family 2 TIM barrel-domain containing protein [uncultured Duncaniella sp.]|uniref:glycoside hydrolase family 2 TIM barrel-domain containing protein n=1 Tax=uncultured Duncaniella sp. TaxID=2768039 RepID=UPI0025AA1CF0|nr:glycoside hydrolase family 2 TIM barrel-domain containing protein [uncultured Duncaniella sp.]